MRGLDLGLTHFKFFPAMAAGGWFALKALAAPFGQCRFCPTGGIGLDNASEWLAFDPVLCVGGSWGRAARAGRCRGGGRQRRARSGRLDRLRFSRGFAPHWHSSSPLEIHAVHAHNGGMDVTFKWIGGGTVAAALVLAGVAIGGTAALKDSGGRIPRARLRRLPVANAVSTHMARSRLRRCRCRTALYRASDPADRRTDQVRRVALGR